VNRAVALTLWIGTAAGVALCAAATLAHALSAGVAPLLARLGVLAFFATPPLRLLVIGLAFAREGRPRLAAAALSVLAALLLAALRAAL
jgi:hypothetical protein